ncbi:DUF6307 family protein [Actinokineospora enzanensis]|uniref:DUF6307 family protein n=1 Tax=Actinokineospora enzanensis TaxID=155975 RepID=UPI00037F601E|nr:DUF6307 family protein [Actinokineospora enzanensis]
MPDDRFVSRHERRVVFVCDVIKKNSALGDEAAHALAVRVIHELDHIPEPTR